MIDINISHTDAGEATLPAAPELSTCLLLELALPSSLQPHWQSSWVAGPSPLVLHRFHFSSAWISFSIDVSPSVDESIYYKYWDSKKTSDSSGFFSLLQPNFSRSILDLPGSAENRHQGPYPYPYLMWILPKGISSDEDFYWIFLSFKHDKSSTFIILYSWI